VSEGGLGTKLHAGSAALSFGYPQPDLGLCLREPGPDRLGTSFEILLAPSGAPALHPATAMSYNV
jgi:hypothetical protein